MHGEFTAAARSIAMRCAIAAMHLDEAPYNRQADAQAALGSVHAALSMLEQVKHTRLQFFTHADAAIANAYDDVFAGALGAYAHLAPFGSKLDGVAEQVADD